MSSKRKLKSPPPPTQQPLKAEEKKEEEEQLAAEKEAEAEAQPTSKRPRRGANALSQSQPSPQPTPTTTTTTTTTPTPPPTNTTTPLTTAAKSVTAPAAKKGGKLIAKGLTDAIFIAVPSLDHLLLYNTIRGKLDRRNIVDNNSAWKTAIKSAFKAIGEDPLITDLDSSPWKDNPSLLASARKRTLGLEWKWKKVINDDAIASGREAGGLPAQPFSKQYRDEEKKYRQSKKKAGKKVKQEDGEDGESDEASE